MFCGDVGISELSAASSVKIVLLQIIYGTEYLRMVTNDCVIGLRIYYVITLTIILKYTPSSYFSK